MEREKVVTVVDGAKIITENSISAEMAKIIANPNLYTMALNGQIPKIDGLDPEELMKSAQVIAAMD